MIYKLHLNHKWLISWNVNLSSCYADEAVGAILFKSMFFQTAFTMHFDLLCIPIWIAEFIDTGHKIELTINWINMLTLTMYPCHGIQHYLYIVIWTWKIYSTGFKVGSLKLNFSPNSELQSCFEVKVVWFTSQNGIKNNFLTLRRSYTHTLFLRVYVFFG